MLHKKPEYKGSVPLDEPLTITFTDSTGVERERCVIPQRVWFGSTEWHPDAQWLLDAYDMDRHAVRSFELARVRGFDSHTVARVLDRSADQCAAR